MEERLYNLLPRIYRRKDLDKGQPLRALMAILESEYQTLEQDIQGLYNNWFIETCAEWCIPYIGDLLGIDDLTAGKEFPGGWRALVANTIGYRRRKGTIATLANAVRDATGWKTMAKEFFEGISTTQSLKHLRPQKGGTINLKNKKILHYINTPFDSAAHTVDIRGIPGSSAQPVPIPTGAMGKYNINNIGLFIWRLQSYPVFLGDAWEINAGYFTFNPFGLDIPLFNLPETQTDNSIEPRERNLPKVLYRGEWPFTNPQKILKHHPVLRVFAKNSKTHDFEEIKPGNMRICNLEHWRVPNGLLYDPSAQAAIDSETGRIVFLHDRHPTEVKVNYSYGFSGNIGGGPYSRTDTTTNSIDEPLPWTAFVSRTFPAQEENPSDQEEIPPFPTITAALQAWAENGKKGIIRIIDNSTYEAPGSYRSHLDKTNLTVDLEGDEWLVLEAADGMCPCIASDFILSGTNSNTRLDLKGLWIDGTIKVSGRLSLNLSHCTIKPQKGTGVHLQPRPAILAHQDQSQDIQVSITHSITGPICLPPNIRQLQVQDSIIDGLGDYAVSASQQETGPKETQPYGPPTLLEKTTLLGRTIVTQLLGATDVLFTGIVTVKDRNTGFVRFSYVPLDSKTPVLYQCRSPHQQEEIKSFFTSVNYGHPGYGQLSSRCPQEIKTGAGNGSEMGAFNHLFQSQREANLQDALDEYFPCGLKAEVFYVT